MEKMDIEEVSNESKISVNMMDLPPEMINKILLYLTYEQVSKLRAVNQRLNTLCSNRLNNGFTLVEMLHARCTKRVKSMLPRRESERKIHPLARHSDILISVETRLSMLSMTFTKYIETNQCCFFPGKVLDEAFRVLHKVNKSLTQMELSEKLALERKFSFTTALPRPHEFLQEYRDISSMAMEYFDEKILPGIKEKMKNDNSQVYYYKIKPPSSGKAHPIMLSITPGGVRTIRTAGRSQDSASASSNPLPALSSPGTKRVLDNCVGLPASKLLKLYRLTNQKCSTVQKLFGHVVKKTKFINIRMKLQTSYMQRKLQNQKQTIQKLKKELKETKSAMNVMRKDINLMKAIHKEMYNLNRSDCSESSTVDQPGTSRSNLSISVTSTVTVPSQQQFVNKKWLRCKKNLSSKGMKRSLKSTEGDGNQEKNTKKSKSENNVG